jgi:hypothetical protein
MGTHRRSEQDDTSEVTMPGYTPDPLGDQTVAVPAPAPADDEAERGSTAAADGKVPGGNLPADTYGAERYDGPPGGGPLQGGPADPAADAAATSGASVTAPAPPGYDGAERPGPDGVPSHPVGRAHVGTGGRPAAGEHSAPGGWHAAGGGAASVSSYERAGHSPASGSYPAGGQSPAGESYAATGEAATGSPYVAGDRSAPGGAYAAAAHPVPGSAYAVGGQPPAAGPDEPGDPTPAVGHRAPGDQTPAAGPYGTDEEYDAGQPQAGDNEPSQLRSPTYARFGTGAQSPDVPPGYGAPFDLTGGGHPTTPIGATTPIDHGLPGDPAADHHPRPEAGGRAPGGGYLVAACLAFLVVILGAPALVLAWRSGLGPNPSPAGLVGGVLAVAGLAVLGAGVFSLVTSREEVEPRKGTIWTLLHPPFVLVIAGTVLLLGAATAV